MSAGIPVHWVPGLGGGTIKQVSGQDGILQMCQRCGDTRERRDDRDNALRVSLAFLVKLENKNEKDRINPLIAIMLYVPWSCVFMAKLAITQVAVYAGDEYKLGKSVARGFMF